MDNEMVKLISLKDSLEPLIEHFNRNKSGIRFLSILSST